MAEALREGSQGHRVGRYGRMDVMKAVHTSSGLGTSGWALAMPCDPNPYTARRLWERTGQWAKMQVWAETMKRLVRMLERKQAGCEPGGCSPACRGGGHLVWCRRRRESGGS